MHYWGECLSYLFSQWADPGQAFALAPRARSNRRRPCLLLVASNHSFPSNHNFPSHHLHLVSVQEG
jgi:hypothetical protein